MLKKQLFLLILLGCSMVITVAQETETPQLGDRRVDEKGISQVYVPSGCFLMGTSEEQATYAQTLEAPDWSLRRLPSEQPQHEVCLTQGYWIDEFEVTNADFQLFVDDGGYTAEAYWSEQGWNWLERQKVDQLLARCPELTELEHPKVCITWFEAQAYALWREGHLPTEAEWEFAARGEESLIYPWGNEWDTTLANVENSEGLTPVGSYPDGVSWVGAQDMAGNAMEWVADWISPNYKNLIEPKDDPTGATRGAMKVEKGGWWGSNAVVTRSAYRHFEDPPTYQDHHIGFRVVTPISDAS